MPLGKYYCDYCDKQFQDTPAARRRHLQGTVHQRAKALWYDSVRSASQGLHQGYDLPPPGKGLCNRFVRTGSCQYGDSCKYYHPKTTLPNMSTQGREGTSDANHARSQGIGFQQGEASLPSVVLFEKHMGTSLRNLPPSLWPPPEGGYPPLPFIDWG
ncbi:zinc finger CCCH domain-containing protein 3 [Andrographis paniculata]|uniref:zinc finger CCCH domain-containing protein 3 n=1 Tax=Andrographis paniculata TaxID=175694 RepID=UPI0021E8181B|nr:zinc finger CCCH domain-containing protein 3 [Andrographis paniculata]XP_051136868.1 zinc finger CCCH domain-containing protein 3 [Andrographis paniculata]